MSNGSEISALAAILARHKAAADAIRGAGCAGSGQDRREAAKRKVSRITEAIAALPIATASEALVVSGLLIEAVLAEIDETDVVDDYRRRLLSKLIDFLEREAGHTLGDIGLESFEQRIKPFLSRSEGGADVVAH